MKKIIVFLLFVLPIAICSCNKADEIDYPTSKTNHSFSIVIDTLYIPHFTSSGILIGADFMTIMCTENNTEKRQIINIHRYSRIKGYKSDSKDFYIYLDRISEFNEYLSQIYAEYRKNKKIIKDNNIDNVEVKLNNIGNLNAKKTNGLINEVTMDIDNGFIHTIISRPINENNFENSILSIKNEAEFQFLLSTLQKDEINKKIEKNRNLKSLFQ